MGRSGFKVIFRLFLLMSRWTWNQRSAWSPKQKCSHSPTTWLVNCGLIFAEKRGDFPWEFLSFLRRRMAANRSEQETFEHQPSVPRSSPGQSEPRAAQPQASLDSTRGRQRLIVLASSEGAHRGRWVHTVADYELCQNRQANGDAWERGDVRRPLCCREDDAVLKQIWAHLKFIAWDFCLGGEKRVTLCLLTARWRVRLNCEVTAVTKAQRVGCKSHTDLCHLFTHQCINYISKSILSQNLIPC